MSRSSHADDPDARQLRDAIAAEITALRDAFTFRSRETAGVGDRSRQVAAALKENPAWAAGVAAGALAGVIAALRRRLPRPERTGATDPSAAAPASPPAE